MVSTTIKSDGDTARNVRQILSEHYDLEIKYDARYFRAGGTEVCRKRTGVENA